MSKLPAPDHDVLSTLNEDGTRRWLNPKVFEGRFLRRRTAVAWALMVGFVMLPYLRLGGYPVLLFDLAAREFHVFGATFLATDTRFLMLLLLSIFAAVFLLTAVFGRVWCGWACPQTVYLEFVFRPLERLILGKRYRRDRDGITKKHALLWGASLMVALIMSHTFLAYFVGMEDLWGYIQESPSAHPVSFAVMLFTTVLIMIDFVYFREQLCIVACPYGRFQSVLLDRDSLIVGYDEARGEPRGKKRKKVDESAPPLGDCVDCQACLAACPTGIDIRRGLQMECIHCTQCMDACDSIMDKLGRSPGLIRYTSKRELQDGEARRVVRPRVIIYSIVVTALVSALTIMTLVRAEFDVTVLRDKTTPYQVLDGDRVSNQLRLRIRNRTGDAHDYTVSLPGVEGARLAAPENPMRVEAGDLKTMNFVVVLPASAFENGALKVNFQVEADNGQVQEEDYKLLGPLR